MGHTEGCVSASRGVARDSTGEELVEIMSLRRELHANRVAPGKSRYVWAAIAPTPGFAEAGSVLQTPDVIPVDNFWRSFVREKHLQLHRAARQQG